MIEKNLEVTNRAGIHARPAAAIARTASLFKSDITLELDTTKINAKSVMGIITLGAIYKTVITCKCQGEDELAAMHAIEELFANRFEEK